jgi:hypothetical protein
LRLQKLKIDRGYPAVILPLDVFHARPRDAEDRHPSAVDSADHYLLDLSSSDESKGSEEKVIGLEHGFTSFPLVDVDGFKEER